MTALVAKPLERLTRSCWRTASRASLSATPPVGPLLSTSLTVPAMASASVSLAAIRWLIAVIPTPPLGPASCASGTA